MGIKKYRSSVAQSPDEEISLENFELYKDSKHISPEDNLEYSTFKHAHPSRFDTLYGESPAMQKLYDQLSRISDTDMTVLIDGESGTGKELIARAIHNHSRRVRGPFIAISCPALPDNLLESELFGYEKGAFTDARTSRCGILLQANGGTVFLDEIGDIPLSLQPKLLRALETHLIRPIGGYHEIPFNARVITATNHNLEADVEKGQFREDLFYRINVIEVRTAPLRERDKDPLVLAHYFVDLFAAQTGKHIYGFTDNVAEKLLNYSWPGNVRELRNVIERAVALTHNDKIILEDLPEHIKNFHKRHYQIGGVYMDDLIPLSELEHRYIQHVLGITHENKTLAAQVLGIDRKTLYRKINH
jgi:transcriptional regulator with PAS, ATPase and Fis domain